MVDIHETRRCPHGKLFDDHCEPCEHAEAAEYFAEHGHYPTCGVHEGRQRGPCTCKSLGESVVIAVEEDGDEIFTPIPAKCLCGGEVAPRDGFHKCGKCGGSYGPVSAQGERDE